MSFRFLNFFIIFKKEEFSKCIMNFSIQKNLRLLMASADGYFYMFDINTQEGGMGQLVTQSSIHTQTSQLFCNNFDANKLPIENEELKE